MTPCADCPLRGAGLRCFARLANNPLLCRPEYRAVVAAESRAANLPDDGADDAPGPTEPDCGAGRIDPDAFITRDRLAADTRKLIGRLPADIDAVAAIVRSGMLPGAEVAAYLHVPLFAVNQHTGIVLDPGSGARMLGRPDRPPRRVLLIDDTAARGGAMRHGWQAARRAWPGVPILRAVVYAHPLAAGHVDLYQALYDGPHFLEWNWNNAGHGLATAYDFDGILCRDFTPEECRSMEAYRAAMATVEPRYLPRRAPVPLIVTGRHESTRDVTEAWLERWGVKFGKLIMWEGAPHPPSSIVAPWKARHYAESSCAYFAESDPGQAETIRHLTGRPVICPAAGRVYPAAGPPNAPAPKPAVAAVVASLRKAQACPDRATAGCGCGGKAKCGRAGGRLVYLSDCRACVEGAGPPSPLSESA